MDGVIVDFASALELQSEETLKEYEGRLDDVFHKKMIITLLKFTNTKRTCSASSRTVSCSRTSFYQRVSVI